MFVDVDGGLWSWGSNSHGELGAGDTAPRQHPTLVKLNGKKTTRVRCGSNFGIALGRTVYKRNTRKAT